MQQGQAVDQCTMVYPSLSTTMAAALEPRAIQQVAARAELVLSSLAAINYTLSGFTIGCPIEPNWCFDFFEEGSCPVDRGCFWECASIAFPATLRAAHSKVLPLAHLYLRSLAKPCSTPGTSTLRIRILAVIAMAMAAKASAWRVFFYLSPLAFILQA